MLSKDLEEYIQSILQEIKNRKAKEIYETILVPHFEEQAKNQPKPISEKDRFWLMGLRDGLENRRKQLQNNALTNNSANFDNLLPLLKPDNLMNNSFDLKNYNNNLNNQTKPTYIENSYKNIPTIQNQPLPEMKSAPPRAWEDKIQPKLQNTIDNTKSNIDKVRDSVNHKLNVWTNMEIDRSKPIVPHEKITNGLIKSLKSFYPISSDMYTDGMDDFSRAKQNKNAKIINMKDIESQNLKNNIKAFGTKDNERGVYYNKDSKESKSFSNSKEVKDFFEKNKDAIKQGKMNKEKIEFDAKLYDTILNPEKFDHFSSIQHGRMVDMKIDDNGQATGKLVDRSDFKKRDVKSILDVKNILNNHGYNMQEKGNYDPHFSVIDILTQVEDPEEAMDLLKKLRKYFRYR